MFDKLRTLFTDATAGRAGEETGDQSAEQKTRLAVAALLIEAARADDDFAPAEAARIEQILRQKFTLTDEATAALMAEATAAQRDAHDLYQFSRVVKDALDHDEKCALVEDLWRVILVDDTRDPFEDALMRRLGGLIYVSDVDIGRARRAVLTELT